MVISRPHLFFFMRGNVSLAKKTQLIKSWSMAACHSSFRVSSNNLDGGPPELVTQISIRLKRVSTAETKAATALASVTSTACWNTSRPLARWIFAAADCRSLSVRAQIATSAPSSDNSLATANPKPVLAPATMATRPFNPKSIRVPQIHCLPFQMLHQHGLPISLTRRAEHRFCHPESEPLSRASNLRYYDQVGPRYLEPRSVK